jgi:hypothetical protein
LPRNVVEIPQFTLTAGVAGKAGTDPNSQAENFTLSHANFDGSLMEAAGIAWLAARGYEGTVSNGRLTSDGVTPNAEGKVNKRKGRVKVVSEGYTGEIWVRDAKSTRGAARTSQMNKYRQALIAAGIDPDTL